MIYECKHKISTCNRPTAYSIGTEQVFNVIRKLKNDKRDGLQDFYSNHITNASGRMIFC